MLGRQARMLNSFKSTIASQLKLNQNNALFTDFWIFAYSNIQKFKDVSIQKPEHSWYSNNIRRGLSF